MQKAAVVMILTAIVIMASTKAIIRLAFFSISKPQMATDTTTEVLASTPIPTQTLPPTPSPTPPLTPSPNNSNQDTNNLDLQLSMWEPPSDINGSVFIIDYPTNNTVYSTNSLILTIHAGIQHPYAMLDVLLQTDWSNETRLFYNLQMSNRNLSGLNIVPGITITTTLCNIPEGNHTLTVIANSACGPLEGSSTVFFTIDETPQS